VADRETPQADTPDDDPLASDAVDGEPTATTVDPDPADLDDDIWDGEIAGMPRDRAVRLAQIGLVVLAVIVVAAVLIAKGSDDDGSTATGKDGRSSSSTTAPKAAKPAWPPEFAGRVAGLGKNGVPASEVKPDAEPGIYVWGDFDGMHVWVVKGEGVPAVSGVIDSNAEMQKAVSAVDGAGEVTVEGKRATFTFPGEAPIEGVDFNPGFYSNKVVILLNGPDGPIDPALVRVGKKGAPGTPPLVFEKKVQD
jgi:hypothetical protein